MKAQRKVLVLGGTGMLGWAVASLLARQANFNVTATYSQSSPLGLPNLQWQHFDCLQFKEGVVEGFDYVINCLGLIRQKIDLDNLEHHMRAIEVNASFAFKLALACKKYRVKCIAIATDCVYSSDDAPFREDHLHSPTDIYAATKSMGEVCSDSMAHIRCSVVGQEWSETSVSLMSWLLSQPEGNRVPGYIDHLWNGVSNLHYARVLIGMIEQEIFWQGVQHLVPGSTINKADLLREIAVSFGRQDLVIDPISSGKPSNRLLSTSNTEMNLSLWRAAGYDQPPDIPSMIRELSKVTAQIQPLESA